MPTYLVIYHAPQPSPDAPSPDPEQIQASMDAWYGWAQAMGDALVDMGHPLSGGVRVNTDGTAQSTADVAGYSLITADSWQEAVEAVQTHPHLTTPGHTIEVHEAQPLPGA